MTQNGSRTRAFGWEDPAAACAVPSTLPAGPAYTSLDLNVKFLRAVTVASGPDGPGPDGPGPDGPGPTAPFRAPIDLIRIRHQAEGLIATAA
jgi:hypothetical protein